MIRIMMLSEENMKETLLVLDKQFGKDQESSIDFNTWLPISISDNQDSLKQKAQHNIEYLRYWVAFDDEKKKIVGITGIYIKKDQGELAWLAWTAAVESYPLEDVLIQFAANMARGQGRLYLADFFDEGDKDANVEQMLSRNSFELYDLDQESEAPEGSVHYKMDLRLK